MSQLTMDVLIATSGYLMTPYGTFICSDGIHWVFSSTKISVCALACFLFDLLSVQVSKATLSPTSPAKRVI